MRLSHFGGLLLTALLTSCLDPDIRIVRPVASSAPVQAEVVTEPVDKRQVDSDEIEKWIVTYTNQAREQEKLQVLARDSRLAAVARAHSLNMAENAFFSHVDPAGRAHQQRLDQRYPGLVRGSGENIARYPVVVGSDQDLARRLVDGWLNSPGHRANILRPSFTAMGAGIAQDGIYVLATQVFAAELTQADPD
ncbi:MAG: CAP domain-containing protein [Candidatus Sericytochromatia bacterium]